MNLSLSSTSGGFNTAARWLLAHPYVLLLCSFVFLYNRHICKPKKSLTFIKDLRKGIEIDEYDVVIIGGG
jgi:hypothetical protein